MKGEERSLLGLLEGQTVHFIVPVYQRNYDWKQEQCKQLFDDLEEIIAKGSKSHFFGSIVSKADEDIRLIIDGQQRIATVSLILLALLKYLRDGVIVSKNDNLIEQITEVYIIDKWSKEKYKLKLKLVKDDQAAFEAIYEGQKDELLQYSNITQNYLYFCDRIAKTRFNADELFDAIKKLMIIDISLSKEDDAQRIFESLNSTGLELTEGDKIRNFILMDLGLDEQENYYEQYWNPIEKNTDFNVSAFTRHWLAAVRRKTPAIKKIYAVFKEYVRAQGIDTKDLLEELLKYSNHFKVISKACSGSEKLDGVLRRIAMLDMSVTYPYFLNLFEYRSNKKIDDESVFKSLCFVETYLFRRWVCRVPTNALNGVFETLHSEILRGVKEGGNYSDVLAKILLSKEGSGHFPDDDEFMEAFERRDFYHIGDLKYYLYDRLERGDNLEHIDVVKGLQEEKYSVEHIMPRSLSKAWKNDLGVRADAIHERWINSMANLTLTAYNSRYSNRRFIEKRNMKNGFKDSGFMLNEYVKAQKKWSEKQLKERDQIMRNRFLELWPMITSDFEWSNDAYEEHALGDDFDFTGRKIAAYSFVGSRFAVKTWAEMICDVLTMIYELEPVVFHRLVPEDSEFPGHFFFQSERDYSFMIGDGVFFNPGSSTATKISILKIIFDAANIDYSELLFELYKSKEDDEPDES